MRRINKYGLVERNQRFGGETLEYALIAGIIVVALIAVIGTVGDKLVRAYQSRNSAAVTQPTTVPITEPSK
jgi:Flp pilus assembly pilin Flp